MPDRKDDISEIPYLRRRGANWFWEPGRHVRALGFSNTPLGGDEALARAAARELNQRVERERARLSGPDKYTGSLRHLVDIFRGNPARAIRAAAEWDEIAEKTRREYNKYMDRIIALWGDLPARQIRTEDFRALRDSLRDAPFSANAMLRVCSVLYSQALQRPQIFGIHHNPVAGVPKFGKKHGVRERSAYWSRAHERAFLRAARRPAAHPSVYIGFVLMIYCGQRPSDILSRPLNSISPDLSTIRLVQSKTGEEVWIPIHRNLRRLLRLWLKHLRARRGDGYLATAAAPLLPTATGRFWGFRNWAEEWDAVAAAAGLGASGLQRRDLRRTAVVRLAEAGCTIPEIAAITGHTLASVTSILQTYLPATFTQARRAISKLEAPRQRASRDS